MRDLAKHIGPKTTGKRKQYKLLFSMNKMAKLVKKGLPK